MGRLAIGIPLYYFPLVDLSPGVFSVSKEIKASARKDASWRLVYFCLFLVFDSAMLLCS
jgi:hypothetical protein